MTPGEILNERYRVEKLLGRGGEGSVFLCADLRLPDQPRAVKRIPLAQASVDEARLLAGVRHPNLPMIIDHFEQDDAYYLVMEFIPGVTMADWVERHGPPGELAALKWGLTIAQVLTYLHSQSPPILFRDLKPENVLVRDDGLLKLVDFGLAGHLDRTETAAGSVGYAAPEQWDDEIPDTVQTDLYGLGATLYFLLTGSHPSAVYGQQISLPGVLPATYQLVSECQACDPNHRPPSADTVAQRLAGAIEALSPRHRPIPEGSAVRTAPAEHRQPLLVLATMVYLLVNLATVGLMPRPTDDRERGRQLMQSGQYTRAFALLDRWLAAHPRDSEVHVWRQNMTVFLTEQPYFKMPVVVPLTGLEGSSGETMLAGSVMAQQLWNQSGKKPLMVLDVFDNQADTARTAEILGRLAADDEVRVVIGPFTSQATLGVAQLLTELKLPLVAPAASDPRIFEASSFVFSAADTNASRLRVLADHFSQQGQKKATIFLEEELIISESMARFLERELEERGGQVVQRLTYPVADLAGFEPGPIEGDFVFISDYRPAVVARLARRLRQAGVSQPLASQSVAYDPQLLAEGGSAVEGMMLSSYFDPFSQNDAVRRLVERYQRTFEDPLPSHTVVDAFDVTTLLGDLVAAGRLRTEIRDHLDSLGRELPPYKGLGGEFAPGKGLEARRAILVTIKDGRYVTPEPR